MRDWLKSTAFRATTAAVLALTALPLKAETLADAMIAAYRNSHLLEQNRAVLRATDENVAQAISSLRPVVSYALNYGYTRTENRSRGSVLSDAETFSASLGVSADLTLFDFGRRKAQIEVAKENVLAARQSLVSVEQDVLLSAVQAFVDVKLAEEIVALRQSNVRLITQEQQAAQDRFDVGEITRTDVSIAQARLAAARALLATADGTRMIARESYKAATGNYPGRLARLPSSPRIGKSLEDARVVARRAHPAILAMQHQVKAADYNVDYAKANMNPTIGLSASYNTQLTSPGDLGRNGASVGVSMGQTLYAGGRLSSVYRAAIANKEATRSGLHQTMVQVEQNLGNAWASLDMSVASIQASDRQIIAAQEAFDGVREEASLGARTTLDVLDAEQELLEARASRLEAEANRYVTVYQILAAQGLLTVEHLNLGIPTYDPAAYYNAVRNAPSTSVQGKKLDRILQKIGQ